MVNGKPEDVTWPRFRGRVCSLQFSFEREDKLLAVSDLRQAFFAIPNWTASRLKVKDRFLHPPVMCLLDFGSQINEFMFFRR